MRISIAQINPNAADFTGNSGKILSFAQKAKTEQKADIVLFPELSLCGSPLLDLPGQSLFVERALDALNKLEKALPPDIAVGLGYIKKSPYPNGKSLVNVYGIILNGQIVFEQIKSIFPVRYGYEARHYFEPARESGVFDYKGERIAAAFSGDILHDPASAAAFAGRGISLLCVPAAVPYIAGSRPRTLLRMAETAEKTGAAAVYVNAAGGSDESVFDGRSFVVTPRNAENTPGKKASAFELVKDSLALSAAAFEEDLVLWDSRAAPADNKTAAVPPEETAGLADFFENPEVQPEKLTNHELDLLEKALVLGIRDYMQKSGFTRIHLGLSGGLDSAIVAYLAVKAAGAENVTGISMPSRFSSRGSKDDAALLAANLGCRMETLPIEDCFAAFLSTLEGVFENRPFDVTEENLQARIRGILLMAWSNKFNSMLLTTGNKSEIALGYCTLYGDTNGAIAPIGDILKTEVFALCRRINGRSLAAGGKAVIPQSTIDKPPSAELRPDQKDEDSLPPYGFLDEVLKLYLHENLSPSLIKSSYPEEKGEAIDRIIKTVARTEFKRRQLPPALWVSPRPFGAGRRIPMARALYELE